MQVNCRSENMLAHEITDQAQSYMTEWVKTDEIQTK